VCATGRDQFAPLLHVKAWEDSATGLLLLATSACNLAAAVLVGQAAVRSSGRAVAHAQLARAGDI
jgi:hypothetical protein